MVTPRRCAQRERERERERERAGRGWGREGVGGGGGGGGLSQLYFYVDAFTSFALLTCDSALCYDITVYCILVVF